MQKSNYFKEPLTKKLRKYKLDFKFFVRRLDRGVLPNLILRKFYVNKNNVKFKNNFYCKRLPDKTSKKQKSIKVMRKILEHQWKTY